MSDTLTRPEAETTTPTPADVRKISDARRREPVQAAIATPTRYSLTVIASFAEEVSAMVNKPEWKNPEHNKLVWQMYAALVSDDLGAVPTELCPQTRVLMYKLFMAVVESDDDRQETETSGS